MIKRTPITLMTAFTFAVGCAPARPTPMASQTLNQTSALAVPPEPARPSLATDAGRIPPVPAQVSELEGTIDSRQGARVIVRHRWEYPAIDPLADDVQTSPTGAPEPGQRGRLFRRPDVTNEALRRAGGDSARQFGADVWVLIAIVTVQSIGVEGIDLHVESERSSLVVRGRRFNQFSHGGEVLLVMGTDANPSRGAMAEISQQR